MKILLQLFSLKLLTSLLSISYSILQVRYFGTSRTIEIYFAAQSLVYLVTSLSQGGQLAEIFLPEFHKLNVIKKGLGFQGLNIVINRMLLWGGFIMIVIFLLTPFFIRLIVPGFSEEDQATASLMFKVLLPYLFFQINNAFFKTVLNAEKKYGRAEFLGVTNTIVNIISLVLLYKYIGVWALVVSMLLGKVIEFLFYLSQLYKIGYKYRFVLSIEEFNHNAFFRTMQNTFLYVGATQIYSIIVTASISFLPEGVFAIYSYVGNLANKMKGLFIQPFLTIFFTQYSILIRKSESVVEKFKTNLTSIIYVNIIIIIGTILLGDFIIDLIWGSKKFDANSVDLAYTLLIYNIFTILIISIGNVYRKMSVAHGKAKKLYQFWAISQLLSGIFSYLLIRNFQISGLYFVAPLNQFLLAFVSYFIYKKTENAISYNILNKYNFISFLLILIAFLIKYNMKSIFINTQEYILIIISCIVTLIVSLYPFLNLYKTVKLKIKE
jgi:putative peptidoglycan lipid II flippase